MSKVWNNETLIKSWAIKPSRSHRQKVLWDFSFSGPEFYWTSPTSIKNSSTKYLVKILLQAKWVIIRGMFIHFVMADHIISTSIFSSTHTKNKKIKKTLILILLYRKTMFWMVKFNLFFWKLFDYVEWWIVVTNQQAEMINST